ncbi:toxic anion resistance protein [Peribacillus butanolivorans]|uniref:Toxic anion resistance protein n=1 Tax=Peribacillus butanolivorans TaxID=421767 RepID=A0ABN5N7G2_9BACI|nr:toxic anion resistance protein [Peribacillus butanolivorans]KQU23320.1 tellurite resistance protein TelA [Bacillus sp. Leaf13]KRF62087.1 tellurite resistance protein TelA [Bacillus sp. Soil768D1]AXN39375.1 toxic anion resistance protein [Peribacillus butanolivorans]KON67434.1 tellurite resistance protein TelA [Peribacillus butanolivorans]MCO0596202.1 toxic anion resistance protein [Peribacillus butanolivorans]
MNNNDPNLLNNTTNANLIDDLLANPFDEVQQLEKLSPQEAKPVKLIDVIPEENRAKAYQLAEQIDPTNHQAMISYGTPAQSKLLTFSNSMLEHVQKKDVGEVGDIISDLMKKLNDLSPDELKPDKPSFFARMFGKLTGSVQEVLSKYQKTGAQIDRISVKLDRSKNILLSDIVILEKLYETNKEYFQALNVYIAAGEIKLEEIHEKTIPELKKSAELSNDQMKFQEVNDMRQFAERLDKRLYDLKLSREITIQSAPQIRLIQNTNQALVEKIQSSIMTAIPLWKNQVAIALTLIRQRHAVEAQKQVSKTTNDLLLKNSEMLKTNTIETAKENERGLVDIETLKNTQANLISTLEETMRIQEEGRHKRRHAEQELAAMENELKQKLLEIKG